MSARSVTINFTNQSDQTLDLNKAKLSKGNWSQDGTPPLTIGPKNKVIWEAHTFTGRDNFISGEVEYTLKGTPGNVSLLWKDPYVGNNVYRSFAPNGFELIQTGGSGDHAVLNLVLLPASGTKTNSSEKSGFMAG